jgi:hypothetical protein
MSLSRSKTTTMMTTAMTPVDEAAAEDVAAYNQQHDLQGTPPGATSKAPADWVGVVYGGGGGGGGGGVDGWWWWWRRRRLRWGRMLVVVVDSSSFHHQRQNRARESFGVLGIPVALELFLLW